MNKLIGYEIFSVMLLGLAYSLIGFAYMHANFPTRDMMTIAMERLTRIENKLDNCKIKIGTADNISYLENKIKSN